MWLMCFRGRESHCSSPTVACCAINCSMFRRTGEGGGASSILSQCFFLSIVTVSLSKCAISLVLRGEGASWCTDKKENQIFLIYKEIQNGAVAKSYMTNCLLIYGEIFPHFLIHKETIPHIWLCNCSTLNFLIYVWGKFSYLFDQCAVFVWIGVYFILILAVFSCRFKLFAR